MLRLTEQVGGDVHRIGCLVGDHQHLRRPCHHIDVQHAIGLALGRRYKGIAWPHQLVHPGDKTGAISQRSHRLGAAHGDNPIHSGDFRRSQHRVVEVFRGWSHHYQLLHSGHLGRNRVHQH